MNSAVSKKNNSKIKTGIPGLDLFLEGGFPPKSYIPILFEDRDDALLFAFNFLKNGTSIYSEKGVFIHLDKKEREKIMSFFNAVKHLVNKDVFIETFYDSSPESFFYSLKSFLLSHKEIKRIVFNSCIFDLFMNKKSFFKNLLIFKEFIEENNLSVVFLINHETGKNKLNLIYPAFSDFILSFFHEEGLKAIGIYPQSKFNFVIKDKNLLKIMPYIPSVHPVDAKKGLFS